jgi:drug/metabolite transporter (DMT)-like permease
MVWLGVLLLAIGFALVVPPGQVPSSTSTDEVILPTGGVSTRPSWRAPDAQGPRRKRVRFLVGLGLMALGGLCIAFGS